MGGGLGEFLLELGERGGVCREGRVECRLGVGVGGGERGGFLLDEFVLRLVHGLGEGRLRGELLLLER